MNNDLIPKNLKKRPSPLEQLKSVFILSSVLLANAFANETAQAQENQEDEQACGMICVLLIGAAIAAGAASLSDSSNDTGIDGAIGGGGGGGFVAKDDQVISYVNNSSDIIIEEDVLLYNDANFQLDPIFANQFNIIEVKDPVGGTVRLENSVDGQLIFFTPDGPLPINNGNGSFTYVVQDQNGNTSEATAFLNIVFQDNSGAGTVDINVTGTPEDDVILVQDSTTDMVAEPYISVDGKGGNDVVFVTYNDYFSDITVITHEGQDSVVVTHNKLVDSTDSLDININTDGGDDNLFFENNTIDVSLADSNTTLNSYLGDDYLIISDNQITATKNINFDVNGGNGNNYIYFDANTLDGDNVSVNVTTLSGDDTIIIVNNTLNASGTSKLTINSHNGNDYIYETGNIITPSEVYIYGGGGDDSIHVTYETVSEIHIFGDDGNDLLSVGKLESTVHKLYLTGGADMDTFVLAPDLPNYSDPMMAGDKTVIMDFVSGTDKIDLTAFAALGVHSMTDIVQVNPGGGNNVINIEPGGMLPIIDSVFLTGVTFESLTADDFIFG